VLVKLLYIFWILHNVIKLFYLSHKFEKFGGESLVGAVVKVRGCNAGRSIGTAWLLHNTATWIVINRKTGRVWKYVSIEVINFGGNRTLYPAPAICMINHAVNYQKVLFSIGVKLLLRKSKWRALSTRKQLL
jgi:hypothetical protein